MEQSEKNLSCSEKLAFDTKAQAQTAATVARHQRGIMLRPYLCQTCQLWHLTSGSFEDD